MGSVSLNAELIGQIRTYLGKIEKLEETLNAHKGSGDQAKSMRFDRTLRDEAEGLYEAHVDILHRIFEQLLHQQTDASGTNSDEGTELLMALSNCFGFLNEVHQAAAWNDLSDPELSVVKDLVEHEMHERKKGNLHMGLYVGERLCMPSTDDQETYKAAIQALQEKEYLSCTMPDSNGLWVFIVLTQKARDLFA